jgi:hypothetical protein
MDTQGETFMLKINLSGSSLGHKVCPNAPDGGQEEGG